MRALCVLACLGPVLQTRADDAPPGGLRIRVEPTQYSPIYASAIEVAPGVWEILGLEGVTSGGGATYFIEWETSVDPSHRPVIQKLTIKRPSDSAKTMTVVLGANNPGNRLERADEIVVDPGVFPQGGSVFVKPNLRSNLGIVSEVTELTAVLDVGDAVGPITCTSREDRPAKVDIISTSGSLTGPVACLPATGDFGSMLGEVYRLDFQAGTIGDVQSPTPVPILADGAVQRVYARQIHAKIVGTESVTPPTDSFVGIVGDIVALGTSGSDGIFKGEIRAVEVGEDPLYDLTGPLRFERVLEGRIWLQRLEFPAFSIHMDNPNPGLKGTISAAVLDHSESPSTVLAGSVTIGPNGPSQIIIDADGADGYTLPAINLGGGAVGLVPFLLHRDDCWPLQPSATEPAIITNLGERPAPNKPIKVRFFGPVTWDTSGAYPPFKIERRRIGGCSPTECWTDETCGFTPSLESQVGTVVLLTPAVPLVRGYEYRITLQTDPATQKRVLRCALPHKSLADADEVADFNGQPILFQVCDTPCWGDADDDGDVEFADITRVLVTFGKVGCPLTEQNPTYFADGDADRDGDRDFTDVTTVLVNFNVPQHCGPGGQSLLAKSDGFATMDLEQEAPMSALDAFACLGAAIAQMGYADVDAFSRALDAMTPEERAAEIRIFGELLNCDGQP